MKENEKKPDRTMPSSILDDLPDGFPFVSPITGCKCGNPNCDGSVCICGNCDCDKTK